MGYVIAAILILLIVGAAVTLFALGGARKQRQPAEGHGGITEPTRGSVPPAGEGGVGGEAEGGDPVVPESERLADRGR